MTLRPILSCLATSCLATLAVLAVATPARGQTTYTWNNTGTDWATAARWDPSGTPGSANTAQFNILGTINTTTINNPVLNSSTTITQLSMAGNAQFTGWNLTGSGSLTAGSTSANGLYTRGFGTFSINLGDGSATSLTLSGPTSTTGGAMNIGTSTTVLLTGNTVASTGSTQFAIRGGTLVLDNSAGNPTAQRLTSSGVVNLNGGGSTIEFRGAASGSTFNGMTGQLGAAGSGDTYLRTVQNGTAALDITFGSLERINNSGNHFFENIGSGFIGDSGKPTVTFTTAPTTRQGVISTSPSTTIPWAVVTSRSSPTSNDVIGRWANYSGGVVASATDAFSGNFGTAPAGTNVLFNPTSAGTVNHSGDNQLASVVFEPQVNGVTYNIGSGNQINSLGVMLSGTRDLTVTGGSLFSTGTAGTRALIVVNPTTSLFTDSNLAANASPVTISGPGFIILTGTSNQIAFSSSQNFNIGGGTLRVTSSNFVPTNAKIRFRGGVLEYNVSGGNFTFSNALGTGANQINWTSNPGDTAATTVGSGGFSAYSTNPANKLTVNIGGNTTPDTLTWNSASQLFVTDGYALKFGSTKSNATVVWQNPIDLGGVSGQYRVREINVTKGVGNAEDKTQLAGQISGLFTTDLLKTGNGVLELVSVNLYQGNTLIQGGTLLASAGANSTGNGSAGGLVIVGGSGTLGGQGGINNGVRVQSGGMIRAGDLNGVGTLTQTGAGGLTIADGGTLAVRISAAGTSAAPGTGGSSAGTLPNPTNHNFLDFGGIFTFGTNANILIDGQGATFNSAQTYSYQIAYFGGTDLSGLNVTNQARFSTINFSNANDFLFSLTGNAAGAVFLNLTPVPEPGTVLGLAAGALGLGGLVRRRWRGANQPVQV
jgi:autotransporter-associated beta strand protein